MNIQKLDYDLTVCKVSTFDVINTKIKLFFISRTDEEISLVCPTKTAGKPFVYVERWIFL